MFAQSEKNRELAVELLRLAHRIWVEDTEVILTADGRRRVLTGRLLASYVTAAQIEDLGNVCRSRGVDYKQFWTNRLCLNTVLNENIGGRRGAYKVETDSEGEAENEVSEVTAVSGEKELSAIATKSVITDSESICDNVDSIRTESSGDRENLPADKDGPQTESEAAEAPADVTAGSNNTDTIIKASEKEGRDSETVQHPSPPPPPLVCSSKSYIVVPMSSEEEDNVNSNRTSLSNTKPVSPPPRRRRGRPRKDPSLPPSTTTWKKRRRSPTGDHSNEEDSDADWDPYWPATPTMPFKRRRRRRPGRPRKRFKDVVEEISDNDDNNNTEEEEGGQGEGGDEQMMGQVGCNFADCGELFSSLGLLAQHLDAVHREASILRCPVCGKYFTLSQPYEQHLAENHLPLSRGTVEKGTSALPTLSQNHFIGGFFFVIIASPSLIFTGIFLYRAYRYS
jgi:uncharacterized C2H2 Zn-finger protein